MLCCYNKAEVSRRLYLYLDLINFNSMLNECELYMFLIKTHVQKRYNSDISNFGLSRHLNIWWCSAAKNHFTPKYYIHRHCIECHDENRKWAGLTAHEWQSYIFEGDIFTKRPELVKSFDTIYDKDSFGALPLDMRPKFCEWLSEFTKDGGMLHVSKSRIRNRVENQTRFDGTDRFWHMFWTRLPLWVKCIRWKYQRLNRRGISSEGH